MVLFREIGRQNRFWNAHRILNSQNVLLGNASETSKRVGGAEGQAGNWTTVYVRGRSSESFDCRFVSMKLGDIPREEKME